MVGIILETLLEVQQPTTAPLYRQIAKAASDAGFREVCVICKNADAVGPAETRRIMDDAGLRIRAGQTRTDWPEGVEGATADIERQLDIMEILGVEQILACSPQRAGMDVGVATEGFAALCERAARRNLRVAIEFIPSRMPDTIAETWAILKGSGAANGGLTLDTMHWRYQPGGPDFDVLRQIPGDKIIFVQLADGGLTETPPPDDYIRFAMKERALPGDGVVDYPPILDLLREKGADPFYAMEIYNAALLEAGAADMAKRVYAAGTRLLSA